VAHIIFEMILIFLISADHYMKWVDEFQLASAPFRLLASIQHIRGSREKNQFKYWNRVQPFVHGNSNSTSYAELPKLSPSIREHFAVAKCWYCIIRL